MANQFRPDVQPTPLSELKALFDKENCTDLEVLRHCIGLDTICTEPTEDQELAQICSVADELAEHMVVICIDTEHYTLNSDEMTEIGVAVLPIHGVRALTQAAEFGDHGSKLMEEAKFHFWRLREKVHLHTTNAASRGPAGNRFGEVRFVTFEEAREYLRDLMSQPIKGVKDLQGYKRPVIVLGHSIGHDREHLNGKDLDLSVERIETIVRYIDTQAITTQAGYWWGSKDPVGLKTLVEKLEFEHHDSHTAANDAGRTLMCAILVGLPKEARTGCLRDIRQVARDFELFTQATFRSMGGSVRYCYNCGSTDHMGEDCEQVGSLHCDECVSRGLTNLSTTHITLHCPIVRDEVAAERLAWYDGQPRGWQPKYPFSSKNRLLTFSERPEGHVKPTTAVEFADRLAHYKKQCNSGRPLKPFVWHGRSFRQSHPGDPAVPPPGQRISYLNHQPSFDQPRSSTRPTAATPSSMPALTKLDFPLPLQNQTGTGGSGGQQPGSFRGCREGLYPGLPRGSLGRCGGFGGGFSTGYNSMPAPRTRGETPYWSHGRGRGRGGRGRGNKPQ